jgi:deoxyhypusine synthase
MRKVGQISIKKGMDIKDLMEEYLKAGVLGAGEIGKASGILEKMIKEKSTIFLGLAGPLTASGLREVVVDLIRSRYISAIVSNGANIVHDLIEAFGGSHYVGEFSVDDKVLREKKIGRAGNIYTKMKNFSFLEKNIQKILSDINGKKMENISPRELLGEIGARITDENSIVRSAYEEKIPIFSPALIDSMLGLQLYFFSQKNRIILNPLKDVDELVEMVFRARKTGGIFLGGGVPKHYILQVNLLRGGIDYGIQITLDREEAGSLSGAKLEEGISWGKAKAGSNLANVIGDATILFPLLIAGVKQRLNVK